MTADAALLDNPDTTADAAEPLVSYAYSYPHKSSYRPLAPPLPIEEVWRDEDQERVALYVHVPFCEVRCGFCNLFTQSRPDGDRVAAYLDTLGRQLRSVRSRLPAARIRTFVAGGGTPTFLAAEQLERLLGAVQSTFGVRLAELPTSVETSPATATADRLRVLAWFGIERISLGVQSFDRDETHALGRPQSPVDVERALGGIRELGFPSLNLDLIYGYPGQSPRTWIGSVRRAIAHEPTELYLYPLYVRPDTGLAGRTPDVASVRIDLYRAARDLLLSNGYEQLSLRCFRRAGCAVRTGEFSCAHDATIGLGCGARSYTRAVHYANRFAVTQAGVRAILDQWIDQSEEQLALATHGIRLTDSEQRRRFVILNLLQSAGLGLDEYSARFQSSPPDDVPELLPLLECGWVVRAGDRLRLTAAGMEQSDMIGPQLYSESVRTRLREFIRR